MCRLILFQKKKTGLVQCKKGNRGNSPDTVEEEEEHDFDILDDIFKDGKTV